MKKITCCAAMLLTIAMGSSLLAAEKASVAIVSFKKCIEKSKIGKREQAHFEQMKREMEQSIERKEKELNELGAKLNEECLDAMTPEAEADLKGRFQRLSHEVSQLQNTCYQTLDQTNSQVVQKMYDLVSEVSKKIARQQGIEVVFNETSCFFCEDKLEISDVVIKELDALFDKEDKQ